MDEAQVVCPPPGTIEYVTHLENQLFLPTTLLECGRLNGSGVGLVTLRSLSVKDLGQVVHTRAAVTEQYNLVPVMVN